MIAQNSIKELIASIDISKITSKYHNETSMNGYNVNELKSALQKYIRRGELDKAMYVAIELFGFHLISKDGGSRVMTNLVHRLQIIFLEDVGIYALNLWKKLDKHVDVLLNRSSDSQQENKKVLYSLLKIVKTLCLNSHSRSLCNYNFIYTFIKSNKNVKAKKYLDHFPSVKEYYDLVDKKLKENVEKQKDENNMLNYYNLVKSIEEKTIDVGYWIKQVEFQGLSLNNKEIVTDKKLSIKEIDILFKPLEGLKYVNLAKKWYIELRNIKERYLTYYAVLIYNMYQDKITKNGVYYNMTKDEVIGYLNKNINGDKLKLDDYVFDMHTMRGKRAGKNVIDFVEEGSKVSNERMVKDDWKRFFNFSATVYFEDKVKEEYLK